MIYSISKVTALVSALAATSTLAAPSQAQVQAPSLSEQITAADKAGLLRWEDSFGGGRFTIVNTTSPSPSRRQLTEPSGMPSPQTWTSNQWTAGNHGDATIDNNAGHYMCPGGGSSMLASQYSNLATSACQAFVSQSAAGQLATDAWWLWQSANTLLTSSPASTGAYVQFLLGTTSETPSIGLDSDLCNGLWNAVAALCQDKTGATKGQASNTNDWTLYVNPNNAQGN
ncbi:hypothetical protein F5Y16DRAFT_420146 [Xylariaceae sp. FL0255]|nr:hypothetical protein F5Y16DRAFT_420146 [Xylariaceae sp. FL0255]